MSDFLWWVIKIGVISGLQNSLGSLPFFNETIPRAHQTSGSTYPLFFDEGLKKSEIEVGNIVSILYLINLFSYGLRRYLFKA